MDYFENATMMASHQDDSLRLHSLPLVQTPSVSDESPRQPTPLPLATAKRSMQLTSPPSNSTPLATIMGGGDLGRDVAMEAGKLARPSNIDVNDFECVLCFRLFCKPVVTSCGHTFCKHCLLSALKFKPNCPLCRCPLHKVKYTVNYVLLNLLEKHFKTEYEEREKEEEEELRVEAELDSKQVSLARDGEDDWLFPTLRDSCLLPCCLILSCST